MKKLIIAALFAATISTGAFANDVSKINVRIINKFTTEFSMAENVSWTLKSSFAKAAFIVDGKKMEAFYGFSGEVIGTSVSVSLSEIPKSAKNSLKKFYGGYKVNEVILFTDQNEPAYFYSLENDNETLVLRGDEFGRISIYKKTKK